MARHPAGRWWGNDSFQCFSGVLGPVFGNQETKIPGLASWQGLRGRLLVGVGMEPTVVGKCSLGLSVVDTGQLSCDRFGEIQRCGMFLFAAHLWMKSA